MKNLVDIFEGITLLSGDLKDFAINGITDDSRSVKSGYLFIACKGIQSDGHDFIQQSLENGARCIVCDNPAKIEGFDKDVEILIVEDVNKVKAQIAKNYYDNPSAQMNLIGVTGTNGKTTVTSLLYDLFKRMGHSVGLISTIEYVIDGERYPSTHTTPDVLSLNRILSEMLAAECEYVFMEVSSHAVEQGRIVGLNFDYGIFTNLSHDHIAYHGSFKNYINAKKKFFDGLEKSAVAIVNIDDKNGNVMLQNCNGNRKSYGLRSFADVKGRVIANRIQGLEMNVNNHHVHFKLVGEFNAYNLLAVFALAKEVFDNEQEVLMNMSALNAASGRFERVENRKKNITGIIDYAHTPDALENVLKTIQALKMKQANVITVVGCGGDRDDSKRPKMAAIAERYSDKVILTSDNPRSEDPQDILDQMKVGLVGRSDVMVIDIVDRRKAIEMSIMMANEHDIILIAGKGHEKYQIIKGERFDFDDKQILKSFFD